MKKHMAVFSASGALALICLNQAGLAQEPVNVPSGTAIVVILTYPLDSSRAA